MRIAIARAGRGSHSGPPAAGQRHTFRSPAAVLVWWVWLLFAAANLADLAVQGRDHLAAVAAATLILVTGVVYVAAQRPRIIADDAQITIRNPLRDHRIGWACVSRVDLVELLRVHCEWGQPPRTRRIHAWAVQHPRRRALAAEAKARRRSGSGRGPLGMSLITGGYASRPAAASASTAQAEAEKTACTLGELATAAKAEAVWAGEHGEPRVAEPPRSTWSWPAIAALAVPALILLAVCLA